MENTRIVQASYPGTGSTLLANILNGLFCPDEPIHLERELKSTTDFVIRPGAQTSSVLNRRYSVVAHATGNIVVTAIYEKEMGDLDVLIFDDSGLIAQSGAFSDAVEKRGELIRHQGRGGSKTAKFECIQNYTYNIQITGNNPRAALNITTTKKGLPNLITKVHFEPLNYGLEFDDWVKNYPEYDLYFVVSERAKENKSKLYPTYRECYYERNNILFIAYEDLLETSENTVDKIVKHVYKELRGFLPKEMLVYFKLVTGTETGPTKYIIK